MIIRLEYLDHLLVLPRRYKPNEFIQASDVELGSYAHEFALRVYACLYDYSIDVKEDFEKYYSVEYSDFARYLYWRFSLKRELVEEISTLVSKGYYVGYGRDTIGIWEGMDFESMLKSLFQKLMGSPNED